MNIILIYATNSGSTYLVSQVINDVLRKKHQVAIKKAIDVDPSELATYDLIIFGTPSWYVAGIDGSPHETILKLMDELKNFNLTNKLFAIFGCGDTSFTTFCGAVDALEKFVASVGGKLLCPSLRIDGYFFAERANQMLVKRWVNCLTRHLNASII